MESNQNLRIEVLLEEVVKRRASDLHLQVGLPPMLRIDGQLVPVNGFNPLDEAAVETLVFAILDQDQKQIQNIFLSQRQTFQEREGVPYQHQGFQSNQFSYIRYIPLHHI